MVNKTYRKFYLITCKYHVFWTRDISSIESSNRVQAKPFKKIRIRFLIFHMVQTKWNSLGRNSDAHYQTLKVHKTWLELVYVSLHSNPSQNLNRPQAWCCIFRAFLVDQGIICIFLCRRSPPLLLFGWQMLRLPRYHSEQWCLRHLQRTAQHRHLQRCYQGRESMRILFLLLPLMKCWTSRCRLDRPSVAHPLAAAPAFTNHRKSSFAAHLSWPLGAQTCRIWPYVVCDLTMTDRLHCWLRLRGTK